MFDPFPHKNVLLRLIVLLNTLADFRVAVNSAKDNVFLDFFPWTDLVKLNVFFFIWNFI